MNIKCLYNQAENQPIKSGSFPVIRQCIRTGELVLFVSTNNGFSLTGNGKEGPLWREGWTGCWENDVWKTWYGMIRLEITQ